MHERGEVPEIVVLTHRMRQVCIALILPDEFLLQFLLCEGRLNPVTQVNLLDHLEPRVQVREIPGLAALLVDEEASALGYVPAELTLARGLPFSVLSLSLCKSAEERIL